MIQRIQSLFIVLGIFSVFFYCKFIPDHIHDFKVDIFALISISSGCVALFSYNNRLRQLKICRFNFYFNFASILYLLLSPINLVDSVCFYFLIVGTISYFLAGKWIKKDIDLIKSTDRLR